MTYLIKCLNKCFQHDSRKKLIKTLAKDIPCECKCKFDGTKCNPNQWWNNNKCWCGSKKHICKNHYVWNNTYYDIIEITFSHTLVKKQTFRNFFCALSYWFIDSLLLRNDNRSCERKTWRDMISMIIVSLCTCFGQPMFLLEALVF